MKVLCATKILIFLVAITQGCTGLHTNESHAAVIGSAVYVSAGGGTMTADYRIDETVTLGFSDGRTQLLRREASGSGIRYVAGQDEWWEHQGEATYSSKGKIIFIGRNTK